MGVIGELIRMRTVAGGEIRGDDLVLCEADHEAELLESRPYLRGWRRETTRHLPVALVVFVQSSSN